MPHNQASADHRQRLPYRVTGDFARVTYSRHATEDAARRAAAALSRKWGVCHVGSEPRVEVLTESGWVDLGAPKGAEN